MNPKTLSATSVQVYEACPARWRAEILDRTPSMSGAAASKGTVCHETLRRWVVEGVYQNYDLTELAKLYAEEYTKLFGADLSEFDDGWQMLERWYNRTDLRQHHILSTEVKDSFPLKVNLGGVLTQIPFTFIFDRCDKRSDTVDEVIDYKTVRMPVQPDQLRGRIQARAYGLAAQMQYPWAAETWVTFDLLRYDQVSVRFTKDENRTTYRYLQDVYQRILLDNDPKERLNAECRFCPRKFVCETLKLHGNGGGSLVAVSDHAEAAKRRVDLAGAQAAIGVMLDEVDAYLLRYLEDEDVLEFTVDDVKVEATASKRRDIDSEIVRSIVGDDLAAEYGKIGVTAVDRLLKDARLTAVQCSQLRQAFTTKWGEPAIKASVVSPLSADDET